MLTPLSDTFSKTSFLAPVLPSNNEMSSILKITNVKLPPEAYSAFDHVQRKDEEELPLVDLEYVHTPSSTANVNNVEVHVSPSASSSADPPFDPSHPFQSICEVAIPPPSQDNPPQTKKQLVARFTTHASPSSPASHTCINACGSLSVPGGLCHPHIHLDKPYLLDRCPLENGTFSEALSSTASAKSNFTPSDLLSRGRRLVTSSISHDITSMRAFVEVDPTVVLMCLEPGLELKKEFESRCEIQIVAFAQDALFYPDESGKEREMQRLMREASGREGVDVVGSAPYVEALSKADQETLKEGERRKKQKAQQRRNIDLVFDLAQEFGKHVDFHLDYDLNPPGPEEEGLESMIPYVLSLASSRTWTLRGGKERGVSMGHCRKLSTFTQPQLSHLSSLLPAPTRAPSISFIALPPSDLYMQARDQPYSTRSRATLPLLELVNHEKLQGRGVNWAMGVNNVRNLFTPQGDADPLALLPGMVGVWQSAKPKDCVTMLNAVSVNGRIAMGLVGSYGVGGREEGKSIWADLVILDGATSVQNAVCAPGYGRVTVKDGRLASRRSVQSELY